MVGLEYVYNAMGQQVIRRMTQAGQTIHSVHDAEGNRLAEYDYDATTNTTTLLREYVWLEGVPVAMVDGATDAVYLIRTDHIGRPTFATDTSGVKIWEATYLPFGGVHVSTGANAELRFPGQWFQSESGLHQNWMREYDPTTGRYIQADPLGLVDGASVYRYVTQNPGRYVDPRGEFGILGAIIGGVSNLAIQTGLNYYRYGNLKTALRCVDIGNVLLSAAFGAIGASPIGVIKTGGSSSQVSGVVGLTTFTKKVLTPVPIQVGSECECAGGRQGSPFLDILNSLQL
jgi:RHS repeat-associated protein